MEKSCRINLRVTPQEKEAWEKAAGGRVSEWLRELANNSASRYVFEEPRPVKAVKPRAPLKKCPRWMHHRPGVFCGSCKSSNGTSSTLGFRR